MFKLTPTKKTIDQLGEAGKYDWSNPDINGKNFTLDPVAKEVELVHLDNSLTTDEVIAELDKQGLKPATITDLLHFGLQYPDKQRKFNIVALGSVWTGRDGSRYVGYLWEDPRGRNLDLYWGHPDSRWHGYYRFLAIKSPTKEALKRREWRKENPGSSTKYVAKFRAENREHVKEGDRLRKARDRATVAVLKEKEAARRKVRTALRTGDLIKPEGCAKCDNTKIQAHHSNYAEPLKVIWLCRDHHNEAHRKSALEPLDTLPSLGNLDRIENKLDKLIEHLGVKDV